MPDDMCPPGWKLSAVAGVCCPPGSDSVTVTVTNCKTGTNLGSVVPFVVNDGVNIATSQNGYVLIACAHAGYTITVSEDNFFSKQVTLTQENIENHSVHVCLD